MWRGAGTDGSRGADLATMFKTQKANRARSVILSLLHPDALDSRVVDPPTENQRLAGPHAAMAVEGLGGSAANET